MLLESGKEQREDLPVDGAFQALPNNGEAGMIGRFFGQPIMEKLADGDRIGAPGGDGTLAGKILKKANHHHFEVNRRVDAGPTQPTVVVGGRAKVADLGGKTKTLQSFVQLPADSHPSWLGHLMSGDPEFGLRHLPFCGEHDLQTRPQNIYSNHLKLSISTDC